ncbi:MAG TPA: hypothetical protein VIL07_02945 [Symbiobacteriaceae bacterium]
MMPVLLRKGSFSGRAGDRGSVLMEVLVVGTLLSVLAAALLASFLGADRTARRAGGYVSAAAVGQAVIEEVRLIPRGDPRLEDGTWNWCPPACPEGIDEVQVEVKSLPGLPESLRKVTVTVRRTGVTNPVRVISYVRP